MIKIHIQYVNVAYRHRTQVGSIILLLKMSLYALGSSKFNLQSLWEIPTHVSVHCWRAISLSSLSGRLEDAEIYHQVHSLQFKFICIIMKDRYLSNTLDKNILLLDALDRSERAEWSIQ